MGLEIVITFLLSAVVLPAAGGVASKIVDSAISGIIGNRVDAAFMQGWQAVTNKLKGSDDPNTQELQRAVQRSFLLALQGIASECYQELVGTFPQRYRGQNQYPPEHAAALQWLDRKLKALQLELKALERQESITVPLTELGDLEALLNPSGQAAEAITQSAKQKLIQEALKDGSVPCYETKVNQEGAGLFERMCAYFSFELAQNQTVHNLFESQILAQLNTHLIDQKLTLQDVTGALQQVAQSVPQVLDRLNDLDLLIQEGNYRLEAGIGYLMAMTTTTAKELSEIRSILQQAQQSQIAGTPEITLSLPSSSTSIPPNPFLPLTGRVSPVQLFGRQQELNTIFELLNSGSGVALIGKQAIGKSSLLHAVAEQAADRLHPPQRTSICLDFALIENEADFYMALCDQVGIPTAKGYLLSRQLQERYLLLLLDNVEKMTWTGFTREIRSQLRGLAEMGALRLVLAARQDLHHLFADSQNENGVSPLEGLCRPVELGVWNETTVKAFITDRLTPTPIRFTETEINQLWQTSQGHPNTLMQACYTLYNSYRDRVSP